MFHTVIAMAAQYPGEPCVGIELFHCKKRSPYGRGFEQKLMMITSWYTFPYWFWSGQPRHVHSTLVVLIRHSFRFAGECCSFDTINSTASSDCPHTTVLRPLQVQMCMLAQEIGNCKTCFTSPPPCTWISSHSTLGHVMTCIRHQKCWPGWNGFPDELAAGRASSLKRTCRTTCTRQQCLMCSELILMLNEKKFSRCRQCT